MRCQFPQYFIEDKATRKEPRNIYYTLRDEQLFTKTNVHDNDYTVEIIENRNQLFRIKDTDIGKEMRQSLEELDAYQQGVIIQDSA